MRVLLAGGGTAGHINPALAIAKAIEQKHKGAQLHFVGTREGLEFELVSRVGYELSCIKVRGFQKRYGLKNFAVAAEAMRAVSQAKGILRAFAPDVVVGTGGYVSFPVVYAAAKLGIKTVIHEQNAVAGKTSRLLSRYADRVMICFEESRPCFARPDAVVMTGSPVRDELLYADRKKAREALGLKEGQAFVLSFAGSLGAKAVNKSVIELLQTLKDRPDIRYMHATGDRGYLWMPEEIAQAGVDLAQLPHLSVEAYIYNMPTVMAAADLVICRAGATTLAELAVLGKPAILIPSPNVANNHQHHNARAFEKAGAALLLEERDLSGARLFEDISCLLQDTSRLRAMGQAASGLAVFDACDKILSVLQALNKEGS